MSQVGGARCYRGNVYHTASYCCHDGIVCLFVYHRAAMIPLRPVLLRGFRVQKVPELKDAGKE